MFVKDQLAFDLSDPGFLEDPYPVLNRLRESAGVFYDERRSRWFVTRHEDVRACLRDKRLGRNFRHVMTEDEIGVAPLDPRWQSFWETERWSLLWLEPPDHTRIRRLVAAAFTPRSVEARPEPAGAPCPPLPPRGRPRRCASRRASWRRSCCRRARSAGAWSCSTTTRSRIR